MFNQFEFRDPENHEISEIDFDCPFLVQTENKPGCYPQQRLGNIFPKKKKDVYMFVST